MLETIKNLDTDWFLYLNQFHSEFWDQVMWWISVKWTWIPLYFLLFIYNIFKYKNNSIWIILTIVVLITSVGLLSFISIQTFILDIGTF